LVLPVAPTIDRKLLGDVPEVELVDDQAPEVLARANAAIVASGTATLEAALRAHSVGGRLPHQLAHLGDRPPAGARALRFAGEPPGGRAVVPELLQADCTPARIAAAAEPASVRFPGASGADRGAAVPPEELAAPDRQRGTPRCPEVLALVEAGLP